jgi:prephenate dehydrogenase
MADAPRMLPMARESAPGAVPVFERIAVVGLGLIGGSIALAARKAWPSALVIGVDRNAVLERAMVRHAVDVASEDPMIISEADLVVLAAPIGSILEFLPDLPTRIDRDAVITDVGSTKRAILEVARGLPPRLPFVGGHPLARAAGGGLDAARADLFAGQPWLLIDEGNVPEGVLIRLSAFTEGLGAKPLRLPSSAGHDRLMAFIDLLPRLAAGALMAVVGDAVGEEGLALAGRALHETTRPASGPADIWRDICRTNGDEIGAAVGTLIAALQDLRQHVSDGEAVDRVLGSANQWRDRLGALDKANSFPA